MKTRKRIALVTPPYHAGVVEAAGTWLNLGFVYLAGSLREAGFVVDYYDAMALWHGWDEIRARLEAFRPDVVATSAFTASAPDAVALLGLAKELNPEAVTVIGNVHATFCHDELLSADDSPVDFAVRGEGEVTLPALICCLDAGDDPAKVPGIAFKQNGRVVVTPEAAFIENLDALKPAWDLVEWEHYTYRAKAGSRLAIVSSSRGCRQNCSFCSQQLFWKRTWRPRAAEAFVDELAMLQARFGVDVVMLADETPTLDRERWRRILHLLRERDLGVSLLMETRVHDILRDEDILADYREAGVEHIYVGVEAGDQALLNLFRKGTKVEQSRRAIGLINGADIVSETSFVLGMPHDTASSIRAVTELAKEYDPDMAFFLAIAPWPYADLYPQLEKHVVTRDWRKYNLVEPVVKPVAMTVEELKMELGRAAQHFYMHRFANLETRGPWKRDFLLEVLRILVHHSYLGDLMREMAGHGGESAMPESVRHLLRKDPNPSPGAKQPLPPIP